MPYLSTLQVCSRRGAIQIHIYLYFYLYKLSELAQYNSTTNVINIPGVTAADKSETHSAIISYRGCSLARPAHEMESAAALAGLRPWRTTGQGAPISCQDTPDSWHVPVTNTSSATFIRYVTSEAILPRGPRAQSPEKQVLKFFISPMPSNAS